MLNLSSIRLSLFNRVCDTLEELSRKGDSLLLVSLFSLPRRCLEMILPIRIYKIVSHSEYMVINGQSEHNILKNSRKGYAANAVSVGKGERQILKEMPLPPLALYHHKGVLVRHGSDHIIDDGRKIAVNDYCADNDDDNNVYKDRITIYYKRRLTVVRKGGRVERINGGIRIGGKFSFNYYHDIYEHLIRLIPLSDVNDVIPGEIPIIVDEDIWCVPSLRRIFQLLSKNLNRSTKVLKKGEGVIVDSLYHISDINYLVPEHNDYTKGRIEDYVFDKEYTFRLRNALLPYRDECDLPKRVFITRKNTSHRHFNEDELFAELEPLGFKKVAPEMLSFEQQMTLFHEAEWIIGGSGAAFTNLLFTSSHCVIVCLYRNSDYIPPVFTAPVCLNEARMFYFQSAKGKSAMKAHTNFTIDVTDFKQFVAECIKPYIY